MWIDVVFRYEQKARCDVRVTMEFTSPKSELVLPFHYTEWLQAAIYHSMGNPVAQAVHDTGFPVDKRSLKLFTFSRLLGKYRANRETLTLYFPLKLVIASPLTMMIQELVNAIIVRSEFRLGPERLTLSTVAMDKTELNRTHIRVRTLSPLSTHSTLKKGDGSTYTVYYHPREREFSHYVTQNLLRKYQAIHGEPWWTQDAPHVHVQPCSEPKMNLVYYKDTIIKGYSGAFDISGPPELLQIGWDAGFGDRNSQGFGLVDAAGGR